MFRIKTEKYKIKESDLNKNIDSINHQKQCLETQLKSTMSDLQIFKQNDLQKDSTIKTQQSEIEKLELMLTNFPSTVSQISEEMKDV